MLLLRYSYYREHLLTNNRFKPFKTKIYIIKRF